MESKYITITVTKGGMKSQEKNRKSTNPSGRHWKNMCIRACICIIAALVLIRPIPVNEDEIGRNLSKNTVNACEYRETSSAYTHTIRAAIEAETVPEPDLSEPILSTSESSVVVLESLDVPTSENANTGSKTYMSYKAITSPSSAQYAMQQEAWTDENGFRRYDDYYMVALGTFYAKAPGETFLITLDTGVSFKAITGDIKDDKHTDSLHQHRNGNIVEFIVDTKSIPKMCRLMGDMSYTNNFSGRIAAIERIADIAAA